MQMITNGGPESSTNVLMFEAYKAAFRFIDRPRSAAIVTILLFIIVCISLMQSVLLSDRDTTKKDKRRRRKINEN